MSTGKQMDKGAVETGEPAGARIGPEPTRPEQEDGRIRLERDFHRRFIDHSPAFFGAIDPKGRLVSMNRTMLDALGYSLPEIVGLDYLTHFVPEADWPALQAVFNRLRNGQGPTCNINRILAKSGSERIVEWHGDCLYNPEGELAFFFGVGIDLTVRRRAEKALRESETRLGLALDTLNIGIWDWNLASQKMVVDEKWAQILGYSPEPDGFHRDMWKGLVHPDDLPGAMAGLKAHFTGRTATYRHEHRLCKADGRWIWIQDQGKVIERDASGRPMRMIGMFFDTTERREAAWAIRKREARYRALFEGSKDAIVISDEDGAIVEANSAFLDMFGANREQVIGIDIRRFYYDPSDMTDFRQNVAARGGGRNLRVRLRRIDGRELDCLVSCNVCRADEPGRREFQSIIRDVTREKRAGEALRRSEKKFRLLFERSADGILLLDRDRFIDCNPAAAELMGCADPSQLIGRGPAELSPEFQPDGSRSAENAKVRIDQAFREGTLRFEWIHKRLDGGEFPVEVLLTAISLGSDPVLHVVWRDIGNRKRAEAALRQSENKFRTLFERSGDGILILDDAKFIDCNPAAAELMGCADPAQLIGRGPVDISPEFQPDGRRSAEKSRKMLDLAFKNGTHRFEWVHQKTDGREIPVEILLTPIPLEDRLVCHAIWRDITDRKRAEAALTASEKNYRTIFNATNDAIALFDPETMKFLDVNNAMCELFQLDPEECRELDLWNLPIGGSPFPVDQFQERIRKALRGESQQFEWMLRDKNERKIWVDAHLKSVTIGGFFRILVVLRDISRRKQEAEEKEKLRGQLQQAQKLEALGTLAGGIAHDFNNILSAIIGYTELTRDQISDDPAAKKYLKGVLKAGDRAKELVGQILAFSRQATMERKPLKIGTIVTEALKLLRASLPSTIELRHHFDSGEYIVEASATQVHQILMNLCTNAAHAMRDTGGVLKVGLAAREVDETLARRNRDLSPGHYVLLTVEDTGRGMKPETLERVFDPYFTTKEKGEGTGLGLAIVHSIVKNHGGAIDVYSEPGQGTVFNIFLPEIGQNAEPAGGVDSEMATGGDERILFVDDEQSLVDIARPLLSHLGYVVTGCASSRAALALFQENPDRFDLVVTDMTMPALTGTQLAEKLLRIRPNLPIVLCTGFTEAITEAKARSAGIRAFVRKPFSRGDLAGAIQRALGR